MKDGEVIFKGSKIQTGDRIKIPKAVKDTLGFKTGDKILIRFDVIKKIFIVERENGDKKK